jgi:hypothetical protein
MAVNRARRITAKERDAETGWMFFDCQLLMALSILS